MTDISYSCPSCQRTLTVSARAAGRTLPCPRCGQKAVVPSMAPDVSDVDFSVSHNEPIPTEPWYFAMASFYAWLLVTAGFLVLTVVPGFMLILASRNPAGWGLPIVFFTFVCYCLPIALALFFSAALIFLFVDVARSLRAIRRQTRGG